MEPLCHWSRPNPTIVAPSAPVGKPLCDENHCSTKQKPGLPPAMMPPRDDEWPEPSIIDSPGARFRLALDGRKAAPGGRRHQRLHGANGRGHRLSRALSFRRRRRRQLARPARPRHQHHGRRAHRRAPHHRCFLAAAAGGHRHRLGQRLQHCPHHPLHDQGRRGRRAHRRPGRRQALRPPPRQRTGPHRRNGATASRPRSTRAPISNSSSWRAPMRWPTRACRPPSTVPRPTSPPAPT